MRATPPPVALPVAAVAIPLLASALVPLADPSTALAERWLRPVPGEVARTFAYTPAAPFARGAHRGADLAAPPGTAVRAVCGGVVVHAGPVAGRDGVVSVRCGARRVSYLPLAAVTVRRGARVAAGARLGAVAAGHGGLHLGVRREADAFGYEDPIALVPAAAPSDVPVSAPPPRPARPARSPRPIPRPSPRPILRSVPQARPARGAVSSRAPAASHITSATVAPTRGPAPWVVWLGLALLLCGASGSRTVVVRRRRQAPRPALEAVR